MTYIYELKNSKLVEVEIVGGLSLKLPRAKDGWSFNWDKIVNEKNSKTYVLRQVSNPDNIEGLVHLKIEFDMLIMDIIEIAPHNIGSINKRFDFVAGCLIAFACRESFKIEGNYRGYLSFISKTNLIEWYKMKYKATLIIDQRMFIDDVVGLTLIEKYLK